jgi:hypothetical protein
LFCLFEHGSKKGDFVLPFWEIVPKKAISGCYVWLDPLFGSTMRRSRAASDVHPSASVTKARRTVSPAGKPDCPPIPIGLHPAADARVWRMQGAISIQLLAHSRKSAVCRQERPLLPPGRTSVPPQSGDGQPRCVVSSWCAPPAACPALNGRRRST